MSIEKHFVKYGGASAIFDPSPSYDGIWIFTVDNLLRNSKFEEGINLFQKFYEETYQKPLEAIFKTPQILELHVGMISMPNSNNIGRCLKYNKLDFYVELTNFLNHQVDRYGKSDEECSAYIKKLLAHINEDNETLNMAYSEALKEKMRRLKDLIDKEINSEYFEAAMKDYVLYKDSIDFTTYINWVYKMASDFQNGMLRLGDFFEQTIDFKKIYEMFNPDTFYLLFAKIIYEYNLISEKKDGVLASSYGYLHLYDEASSTLSKEEKNYNPKIKFILPSGKRIEYSRRNFHNDFQELMERHPEAKSFKLPDFKDDDSKYKDISLMQKMAQLYSDDIRVNWEFLREGEGIKRGKGNPERLNTPGKKDIDTLIYEANMRISVLETSGFIGRPIKGLNTFTGYFAFVYPNGNVILEKFWENESELKPAVGAATYVMTIDNFIKMSKMSRINLVEYIKAFPDGGVKRIFHTSLDNWQRNIYNTINGTYRLEDAINFINGLKSGALTDEQ